MRSFVRSAAAAATAVLALGIVTAAQAAPKAGGKCVQAGGTADMITEDLARFMANAALNNQMKAAGLKPSGPAKVVCKPGYPINCTATQRACK